MRVVAPARFRWRAWGRRHGRPPPTRHGNSLPDPAVGEHGHVVRPYQPGRVESFYFPAEQSSNAASEPAQAVSSSAAVTTAVRLEVLSRLMGDPPLVSTADSGKRRYAPTPGLGAVPSRNNEPYCRIRSLVSRGRLRGRVDGRARGPVNFLLGAQGAVVRAAPGHERGARRARRPAPGGCRLAEAGGQVAPLAAGVRDIEHAVDDLADVRPERPTARRSSRSRTPHAQRGRILSIGPIGSGWSAVLRQR